MANETNVGALLISQVGMFNEAALFMENVVEPKIAGAIDEILKNYVDSKNYSDSKRWDGEFDFSGDNDCWITCTSWKVADQDEPTYKAWFSIDRINDNGDYWTTLFCNQGSEGGEAGFVFNVNAKSFNGQKAWNAYVAKIEVEIAKALANCGFKNLGKGKFFLPIYLDAKQLADAWQTYEDADISEFAQDQCFKPVVVALETIEKSSPLFDEILNGAEKTA